MTKALAVLAFVSVALYSSGAIAGLTPGLLYRCEADIYAKKDGASLGSRAFLLTNAHDSKVLLPNDETLTARVVEKQVQIDEFELEVLGTLSGNGSFVQPSGVLGNESSFGFVRCNMEAKWTGAYFLMSDGEILSAEKLDLVYYPALLKSCFVGTAENAQKVLGESYYFRSLTDALVAPNANQLQWAEITRECIEWGPADDERGGEPTCLKSREASRELRVLEACR